MGQLDRFLQAPDLKSTFRLAPWWLWGVAGSGALLLALGLRKKALAATPDSPTAPTPPTGPGQPMGPAPVLKLGSSGPWVSFLQSLLGIAVTGQFDSATAVAVKAFQASKSLVADGIVGPKSWGALGVVTTPAKPSGPKPPPDYTGEAGETLGAAGFVLSNSIPEREAQILDWIAAGEIDHDWKTISWQKADASNVNHTVQVQVSRRALALSDGLERLIVSLSFKNAQKAADMLGGAMLTTRMSDEIFKQAQVKLKPTTQPWSQDGTMAKTARMVEQSERIENEVAVAGAAISDFIANEGKDWVLTRRFWPPPAGTGAAPKLHNAANFGWYPGGSKSPGGMSVIQSIGLAHDMAHVDYSQLLRFWKPSSLMIDGTFQDAAFVLENPTLSMLLQDEGGTLPGLRHPDL